MSDVFKSFVEPMQRQFALPKHVREAQVTEFLSDYIDDLSGYSDDSLGRAFQHLRKNHRFRVWPTIAECVNASKDAVAEIARETTPALEPQAKFNPWSPASVRKADDLIRSDLGRKAADGGWILSLHDFCRKFGRLPRHTEQHKLMNTAKDIDRLYGELCRSDDDINNMGLVGAGKRICETAFKLRNQVSEIAHGEVGH